MNRFVVLVFVICSGLFAAFAIGKGFANDSDASQPIQERVIHNKGEFTLGYQNAVLSSTKESAHIPPVINIDPQGKEKGVQGVFSVDHSPTGLISYQGRLLFNGTLLNANIPITFSLYTVDSGGTPWWQEVQIAEVEDGIFSVMLGVNNPLTNSALYFQFQQWLSVKPAGAADELSPRHKLGAVGYAMNLLPGATMVDTNLPGGYEYSLFVQSENHNAISGRSLSGVGVSGTSFGTVNNCLLGDIECVAGVYGASMGDSYASYFFGGSRSAVVGVITGTTAYTYYNMVAYSGNPDGYGIWTNGESRFEEFVTFAGGTSGYSLILAINDSGHPLEQGEIVSINGYDDPIVGRIPVVKVVETDKAVSIGVIGIVDVLYNPCEKDLESLETGEACGGFASNDLTISPGEYLGVVVMGVYHSIKVDNTSGLIRPGDLLSSSVNKGYASKANLIQVEAVSFYAPGTIIGKAIGSLDESVGTIPVFVSGR